VANELPGEKTTHKAILQHHVAAINFELNGLDELKKQIKEWGLESGEHIQSFAGHAGTGPIGRTRVAYSPESNTALSSGWDGTLALWDLESGRELHRFSGHDTDFIFEVALSPDGCTALSCGTDQMIIQWRLDIPSLEELLDWIAVNRYVRELTCCERELYQIEPLCTPQE